MPITVRIITRETPSQSIVAAVTRADSGTYVQTGLDPGSSYSIQILAAGGTTGPTITAITSAPGNFYVYPLSLIYEATGKFSCRRGISSGEGGTFSCQR